jgi:Ni,Fe-hydrogenase III large subunit
MLGTLLKTTAPIAAHRGWPRVPVEPEAWREVGEALRDGRVSLLGLWGDAGAVHCALFETGTRTVCIITLPAHDGRLPSLGVFHAPAIRLERALQDLCGFDVVALPDKRPWLDHGRWPVTQPLGAAHERPPAGAYRFLLAEGESLHQIPVGPVHAGIIEPGHFRFTANGETVVRLEARLGYAHKGIETIIAGKNPEDGARIAARVSGDSTVAYSWAYARAVELARGVEPPPRALWIRAVMAEIERIANHLGDIGAVCNDASFALMHTECGILREYTLRAAATAFGHRLMMDRIVPGGCTADLTDTGREAIHALGRRIGKRLPELIELYDNTASLQDRTVGTGILKPDLAATFACGGYVGRASGRAFDARRELVYAPYDALPPAVPLLTEGDVDARVRIRMLEVQASLELLEGLLAGMPAGSLRAMLPSPAAATESTAVVEGFRGDVLAYVRIGAGGRIERCHLRDPSWFQWPLLEAVIEGNIVADFPLCNKSFNCSYSGHDL